MDGFDAASFWVGLGLGLVNGIALVCFTRAWRWAGLPPSGAGRPYNVNPPAPAKRHRLTVELRQRPPRGPDLGPELRR